MVTNQTSQASNQIKPSWLDIVTGAQMLFVAFGALVLVPL